MDKWDERFLQMALLVATWSKDPSTKVGAIIVDGFRRVVSCGYNGAPKGVEEPPTLNREEKLLRTIHAEANALHFAGDVQGCTMYITAAPCAHCAGHIIQRGIRKVVFFNVNPFLTQRWKESFATAKSMFDEADVETMEITVWQG